MKAVGRSCEDFELDPSRYGNNLTMSVSLQERSCEICRHWDGNKKICRIGVFDEVLSSPDQT
nr:hypothetical protein [Thermoanaerobacter sp. CM-CNRG TB177]